MLINAGPQLKGGFKQTPDPPGQVWNKNAGDVESRKYGIQGLPVPKRIQGR